MAETPSFHPEETYFVVVQPRDIVGRSDVHSFVVEGLMELRLDGLCFRYLLGLESPVIEHIEEIRVTTYVQLIGAIQLHPSILK